VKELTALAEHCDTILLFVQAPVNVQDAANGRTRSKEKRDLNMIIVCGRIHDNGREISNKWEMKRFGARKVGVVICVFTKYEMDDWHDDR
jgi:hypothetical protein